MNHKNRKLSYEKTIELLNKGEHGILTLNGDNGYPYALPITYTYFDECIYFHSADHGYKIDILNDNTKACFSLILNVEVMPSKFSAKYESVVATGDIAFVNNENGEKNSALEILLDRFSPEYKEKGMEFVNSAFGDKTSVFKMTIKELTGKGKYN